ncbi:MAG: hypothetical protein E5W82_30875 [Mesorhizobium sp.]|nr:MAG: hypothetical protein E5W82_30875 [Mesorhizobium sp.]
MGYATPHDLAGDLSPRFDPTRLHGLQQPVVGLRSPQQRPHDPALLAAVSPCEQFHGHCKTLSRRGFFLDRRRLRDFDKKRIHHDRRDIRPSAIDGRFRHAGPFRDAFNRQRIEPHLFAQVQCGTENRRRSIRAARARGGTPGQICSAVAVLDEIAADVPSHVTVDLAGPIALSETEIRERMSGNICCCAAYPNIIEAIRTVAGGRP